MGAGLSASQVRSLQLTLRAFEERLREAEAWLAQGGESAAILYRQAVELPERQRAEARALIESALSEIAVLADALGLEAEEDDLRAHMRATMSASWAELCDVRTAQLKRYGPVDPEAAPVVDPAVERLAQSALAIAQRMDAGHVA